MYGGYEQSDFNLSGAVSKKSWISSHSKLKKALVGISMLLVLIFGLCMFGCKPKQVVIEKEKLVYVTKDSIVHRDSTIYVPTEVYKDYSLDTLVLRTSLAESKSWLDTNSLYLVGEIRNLKAVQIKYVEVDKWHTKDSLVYVEKPVPYEVEVVKTKYPWWAWICLIWTIIPILSIAWAVYRKFNP